MQKGLAILLLLLMAATGLAESKWFMVKVNGHEYLRGLLILSTEPVEGIDREIPCILRAHPTYKGREITIYDSLARYDPKYQELKTDAVRLMSQYRDPPYGPAEADTLCHSVSRWEIKPRKE